MWVYLFPVVGYLMGSIPMGLLVSKARGVDVRKLGSGNTGATNVLRTVGIGTGFLVLLLDMSKILVLLILGDFLGLPRNILLYTSATAVFGHNWSLFMGFKGGKGVAVSAALMLYLFLLPGLVTVAVFITVTAISRYVSLGSMISAVTLPALMHAFGYPQFEIAFAGLLVAMLIYKHTENIARLRLGVENRLTFSKRGA